MPSATLIFKVLASLAPPAVTQTGCARSIRSVPQYLVSGVKGWRREKTSRNSKRTINLVPENIIHHQQGQGVEGFRRFLGMLGEPPGSTMGLGFSLCISFGEMMRAIVVLVVRVAES
ncbi:hypothetical protein IW262DRAFT_525582 [Armillaria fumosa]|nr:hypothetical protein IW262DRAFT_525582 [Armillaria fumosa]